MDEYVKVENTTDTEVSLSTTSDPTSSVLHVNKVKNEWFCADLNPQVSVKHEDSTLQKSDHQLNSEDPDIKFGITSDSNISIKLEPLESEELQIKDEIDQSPTEEAREKSARFEYFYCGVCNSKFTYKSSLRRHMRIHTGEKSFKCGICDYKCIDKSNLSRHIKAHTGDKPFKCSVCDYRFIRKIDLSRHIKTHTGEKPFKCGVCDYSCSLKSCLSIHIKIHTGEKPFKCDVCDYRFIQKTHLSRHMKTHTGEKPFKCSICDYSCIRQSNLTRHFNTHTRKNH